MHHFDSLAFLTEVTAVKSHFRSVLWFLRQRRPPELDPAQKVARALLLDELEDYAARGIFPLNTHSPGERRPTFIDEVGTRCAVAHLLDMSGEASLALEVRDRMNFAPVSDIVEEPRFVAWLEAAGFTREEIALVQPAYCDLTAAQCVCDVTGPDFADQALVSYRTTATGLYVTEVHRGAPGIEVGLRVLGPGESPDVKRAPAEAETFERIAWVPAATRNKDGEAYTARGRTALYIDQGNAQCTPGVANARPLSTENASKALLSPSRAACMKYLESIDEGWTNDSCGGCDMTNLAGSSTASLAVLAAIVGAIAARRRR